MGYVDKYLASRSEDFRSSAAIAYLAAIDTVTSAFPSIGKAVVEEIRNQRNSVKLIASENFSSLSVQLAMGNLLTDKYAEGYPYHRFYAGCENIDLIETAAVEELKRIFGSDHAYVQPHSGADANLIAFWSILVYRIENREIVRLGKRNVGELTPQEYEKVRSLLLKQKVMGMSLHSGGHLTHGYRSNFSSKMMRAIPYDVNPKTDLIDYSLLDRQVKKEKPAILLAGYSAYPRLIDFSKMREIADSVGATLMVDMAHFAGLVAGKVLTGENDPVPYADIITSTTHKTLRGPRGGFILSSQKYQEVVNKGCPLVLGGPLPHIMAAKAVAFKEASEVSFRDYAYQVVNNCRALVEYLLSRKVPLVTGGSDNHLIVINTIERFGLTGREAEKSLRAVGLTVNRNMIPFDARGPWHTSGIRLGTAAVTTLGMKEDEMKMIGSIILDVLEGSRIKKSHSGEEIVEMDPMVRSSLVDKVTQLLSSFPLYPELILD